MTQAEEVVEALVADCRHGGCQGRYALNGKTFADYHSGHLEDRDKVDRAWACDRCGSTTFDSCR